MPEELPLFLTFRFDGAPRVPRSTATGDALLGRDDYIRHGCFSILIAITMAALNDNILLFMAALAEQASTMLYWLAAVVPASIISANSHCWLYFMIYTHSSTADIRIISIYIFSSQLIHFISISLKYFDYYENKYIIKHMDQ